MFNSQRFTADVSGSRSFLVKALCSCPADLLLCAELQRDAHPVQARPSGAAPLAGARACPGGRAEHPLALWRSPGWGRAVSRARGKGWRCFQPFLQWALEQVGVGVPAPPFPQMRVCAPADGTALFLVPFSCLVIKLARVCLLLYTIFK